MRDNVTSSVSALVLGREPLMTTFPAVPVAKIARFLVPDPGQDYLSAVRAFRAWVRERLANP